MKISTALDLLMDKGLLSEEDTFTIVEIMRPGVYHFSSSIP